MSPIRPEKPEDVVFRPLPVPRVCRVCGCSQFRACPGGCYWVEDDLCSACVGKEPAGHPKAFAGDGPDLNEEGDK